jgi:hypothetical protein
MIYAELWRAFARIVASDEWYFPSLLATLGRIDLAELFKRQRMYLAAADKAEASGTKLPDDIAAFTASSAVVTQESGANVLCWLLLPLIRWNS